MPNITLSPCRHTGTLILLASFLLNTIYVKSQTSVSDHYVLFTGKKSSISYSANKRTIHLKDQSGRQLHLIFQVSNDGVAFRYHSPEMANDTLTVTGELTTFNPDTASRGFLQPMQIAKTVMGSGAPAALCLILWLYYR